MSFTRVNASSWAVGDKLTSAQANALDIDHANAVDKTGDTLSGTLNVGTGAIACNSTGGITVGGSAKVDANASGASIRASAAGSFIETTSGGGRFRLGDNDHVTYSANRSRTLVYGCRHVFPAAGGAGSLGAVDLSLPVGNTNAPTVAAYGFTTTGVSTTSATSIPYFIHLPGGILHDGATLASVTLAFVAKSTHTGVPAAGDMPQLLVTRTFIGIAGDAFNFGNPIASSFTGGQMEVPLATTYVQYPSQTLAQWQNAQVKTLTFTCTQNNVIDKANYLYHVSIGDECGANAIAGNVYLNLRLAFTNIADARWP